MSDKGVAALKPRANRYAVSDPELRGLWIRVQPTGLKSYATVTRNPDGKQVWTTIGTPDAMTIAAARAKARGILARVRDGLPAIEPKADTVAAVVENWRTRHVEKNRLRTAGDIKRLLDRHVLPVWGTRQFVSIRRSDVPTLARYGRGQARRTASRHGARHRAQCHELAGRAEPTTTARRWCARCADRARRRRPAPGP